MEKRIIAFGSNGINKIFRNIIDAYKYFDMKKEMMQFYLHYGRRYFFDNVYWCFDYLFEGDEKC